MDATRQTGGGATPPTAKKPSFWRGGWSYQERLRLVMGGFALAGLLLVARAYWLQVVTRHDLALMAQSQYQRTIQVTGRRGEILDRFGGVLAVSVKADSFFANPAAVKDPATTAFRLSKLLDLDRAWLERQLRSERNFVWLKRQVKPATAAQVNALALPGIGATREFTRVYPGRFSSAAVLGFTGVDNQGLEGLEYAYNTVLAGEEAVRVIGKDALGRTLEVSSDALPSPGGSIVTTLHPVIQMEAEAALERGVKETQAKRGAVVVMDSQTGELLALAHYPGFNANAYRTYPKENYFNQAVTGGYEPGSTLKVLLVAAALEEGVAQPDTLLFCENGTYQIADSQIHDTHPHGWLTLNRVVALSSNIGAAKLGALMPTGVMHEYLGRFGLGEKTGLYLDDKGQVLAGEATGYVPQLKDWTQVDQAAISFGHGVLVSPLQLTAAVNAIAADGKLMKPLLVRQVRNAQGETVRQAEPEALRQVISPATARSVRDMMVEVVRDGTGIRAAVAGYTVAGKTGTTEKYEFEAKGYSKSRNIASFVGFVPAEKPRLTILAVVEEPEIGRFGGDTAAPIFSQIAAQALPLLGVWPKGTPVRKLKAPPPSQDRD